MMKKDFAFSLDTMLSHDKELTACCTAFEQHVIQLLETEKFALSADWYNLKFEDFIKTASLGPLTPSRLEALEASFTYAASEALELKKLMEATDKHMNHLLHEQMEEEAAEEKLDDKVLSNLQKKRAAIFKKRQEDQKRVK